MKELEKDDIAMLDRATHLAYDRTRLACERTMLAWIRTSTSLITFGFTIYQVFKLRSVRAQEENYIFGPSQFALILVTMGLLALILATLEYRQQIRVFAAPTPSKSRSLAVILGALMGVLGVVAFAVIVSRP